MVDAHLSLALLVVVIWHSADSLMSVVLLMTPKFDYLDQCLPLRCFSSFGSNGQTGRLVSSSFTCLSAQFSNWSTSLISSSLLH